MKKRVTTKHLGSLLEILKQRFIRELEGRSNDINSIEIYANVLSTNHKNLQPEEIRIRENFFNYNLPIPINTTLEIHINIDGKSVDDIFDSYIKNITHGLDEKDFEVDPKTHHIKLQNLKLISMFMEGKRLK